MSIKNFKLFLETYSEDLSEILENEGKKRDEEINEGKLDHPDWWNTAADIVGISDPTGIVDVVNGLDYIRQGKLFIGFLSMVSAIPYAGDAVAKPIIFLAKAGKMKGVTKAMQMAKAGDKAGASKLLRKGFKENKKFAKFASSVSEWGDKLKDVIQEIPDDKIKGEEKSAVSDWIDVFQNAVSSDTREVSESNKIKTFNSFKDISLI